MLGHHVQYACVNAAYLKVRQAGRTVSVAMTIVVGVNSDGRLEVLGLAIGASEAKTLRTDFLRNLTKRDLRSVKLVISDASGQCRKVADQLRPRVPKLTRMMDTAEEVCWAYISFPLQHRTKLHSMDPLERLER